ncbi:MAG: hypothetical protein HWN81_21235 [Candidatus Lokiarchaeota archaeon]|nr:hypothetical protein [Candidatus Lokiarchaeota archaeon]
MTCIHGLDEINCPTCRILKSTTPLKGLSPKNKDFLKIKHPLFKNNRNLDEKLISEITSKKSGLCSPNFISKPRFINEIPNFRNELFYERVKELDLTKEDNHKISKKISLENPEWKFEEED